MAAERDPRRMVAALFVETDGVYFGLPGVEPWDQPMDARMYPGPYPVVAHPPCNKWSPLAFINRRRLPNYEIGDDGGCFASALASVRRYGGILEHPAASLAWAHFGLLRPCRGRWSQHDAEWTTEVDQGRYGHAARKRTWLLYCGRNPPPLNWAEATSTRIISGFLHHTGTDESRRIRPREARMTPLPFRDLLLSIAVTAR